MRRVLLVARREWLEHRRQPAMILSMAAVLAMISGLVLFVALLMALIQSQPASLALFEQNLVTAGFDLADPIPTVVEGVLSSFNFLLFTQFLGMTAVLAGHAVVHERQCGTLPFLMVAPVRRWELVLGKVLGAVGTPWLLYLLLGGGTAGLLALLDVTDPFAFRLPPSPGWLVAFLFGGPAWSLALASAGAALSVRAADVRTAQQGVWLVVFLASIMVGTVLGGALQEDAPFQVVVAIGGLLFTAAGVGAASLLLRRDIHL